MKQKPLLIVVTPIRNEAWILDAFLTCTSSWADYIILADQHSTDGTREIAQRYPKVILIDNPTYEWYEMECRRLLLQQANAIPGDKIIFGLDADEFLSEGFEKTKGWQTILTAPTNAIFAFHWLNLYDDGRTIEYSPFIAEWACHFAPDVDIVEEYRKREHHAVHCQRVPCLEDNRATYYEIKDIQFVHLAKLNKQRCRNKTDFYAVTWVDKNPIQTTVINLYRAGKYYPQHLQHIPHAPRLAPIDSDFDCMSLIKPAGIGSHYIDEMVQVFQREGTQKFRDLNIWDNPDLIARGVAVPKRPIYIRILHAYLSATQDISHYSIIKFIDKALRYLTKKLCRTK